MKISLVGISRSSYKIPVYTTDRLYICITYTQTHALIFDENGITTTTSVYGSPYENRAQRLLAENLVSTVVGRVVSAVYYNVVRGTRGILWIFFYTGNEMSLFMRTTMCVGTHNDTRT